MKTSPVPSSIITRDPDKLAAKASTNIYETIVIVAKRAKQISTKLKEELNSKIADFTTTIDNLEEVHENKEQIEISRFYERMPKAVNLALEELIESKLVIKRENEEEKSDE